MDVEPGSAAAAHASDAAGSVPALEAVNVAKRYRLSQTWALRDVELTIPAGTITALVGPNGAGKSTLIRTWMGFERPTRGTVRVAGIDPQQDGPGVISKVGYVSQSTVLYRGLTVAQHLQLARDLRGDFDTAGAVARLDQLGIPLHRLGGQLSGGQAAQVALSVALGTHATVLLLDEPLAALDPLARHEFLAMLKAAIAERPMTALLSTHNVGDVGSVCDEIAVLGQGVATLQAPIGRALVEHRLVDGRSAGTPGAVGVFVRPGGALATLLRSSDPSLPAPTLEELVMGYLAAARRSDEALPGAA